MQLPRDLHQVGGQGGRGGDLEDVGRGQGGWSRDLHRVGQHLLCGVHRQGGGGGVAGQERGGGVADQLQHHQQGGGWGEMQVKASPKKNTM